jgi:antitoxin (DNA-binding transcriptional repressor) of toxin-antitoxin stability system
MTPAQALEHLRWLPVPADPAPWSGCGRWYHYVATIGAIFDAKRVQGRYLMAKVGIKQLSDHISEIARLVRGNHQTIKLTHHGEVFTRIVPVQRKLDRETFDRIWAERDRLAAEIGKHWPKELTAAQAIAKDRRK